MNEGGAGMDEDEARYASVDPRADTERAVAMLKEDPNYDDDRLTLVTHYIDCQDEEIARLVVEATADLGLDLTAKIVAPDGSDPPREMPYSVQLQHHVLVDADTLLTLRETFEIVAGSFEATYDGWAASPQHQVDF